MNPEVTVKKGQKIVLTCAVHADVPKSAIAWYKGNHKVKKGLSRNRYTLTLLFSKLYILSKYRFYL